MSMPGWADVYGLDVSSEEDPDGFQSSAERVNTIIQKEVDGGVSPDRIIIAGFSQGGKSWRPVLSAMYYM
jgi:phospholipase/carboxylesterase